MTRKELREKAAENYVKNIITPHPASIKVAYINGMQYADEHPALYSITRKAVAREREYLMKKAIEFLRDSGYIDTFVIDEVIEKFKKHMEKDD